MAVVDILENWTGHDVQGGEGTQQITRSFSVTFDTGDDSYKRPVLAWGATGVPVLYSVHPYVSGFYCCDKMVRPGEGPFLYYVDAIYKTGERRSQGLDYNSSTPPLSRSDVYSYSFMPRMEICTKTITDTGILNSAGIPFDPPPQHEVYDLSMRVECNRSTYSPSAFADYIGAINSDAFKGFAAGTVRCIRVDAQQATFAGSTYWEVTFEFAIRYVWKGGTQKGWKLILPSMGLVEYVDSKWKDIMDESDTPQKISDPVYLASTGAKLAKGGTVYYVEFDIYKQGNFSGLGL